MYNLPVRNDNANTDKDAELPDEEEEKEEECCDNLLIDVLVNEFINDVIQEALSKAVDDLRNSDSIFPDRVEDDSLESIFEQLYQNIVNTGAEYIREAIAAPLDLTNKTLEWCKMGRDGRDEEAEEAQKELEEAAGKAVVDHFTGKMKDQLIPKKK